MAGKRINRSRFNPHSLGMPGDFQQRQPGQLVERIVINGDPREPVLLHRFGKRTISRDGFIRLQGDADTVRSDNRLNPLLVTS